jgi:hypothetical protein
MQFKYSIGFTILFIANITIPKVFDILTMCSFQDKRHMEGTKMIFYLYIFYASKFNM